MKLVTSKIVTNHGSLFNKEDESTQELQQLTVATGSMPSGDWVKTRAYCYMVSLLYFDKILQIPLIIAKQLSKIRYREFFKAFTNADIFKSYPMLNMVYKFFVNKAIGIQKGSGQEYCASREWLNVWWYADEYIFIKLAVEGNMCVFYEEARKVIETVLNNHNLSLPENILEESINLNEILLKMPFESCNNAIETSYNIFEIYKGIITSNAANLKKEKHCYLIKKSKNVYSTWDDWYREVVFYGNRKGACLHEISSIEY
jgi:hypothetical protein